jgi:hypothetical protein
MNNRKILQLPNRTLQKNSHLTADLELAVAKICLKHAVIKSCPNNGRFMIECTRCMPMLQVSPVIGETSMEKLPSTPLHSA